MRKLKKYTPTRFKAPDSLCDKAAADYAVSFIQVLSHTKGTRQEEKAPRESTAP